MMRKNTMKTKTWMWIYKTGTTQNLTVKIKQNKTFTAVNQTTDKACAVKGPSETHSMNLLVGLTKTLSFRQDLLPLSGIAEAVGKTKRQGKRERREEQPIILCFSLANKWSICTRSGHNSNPCPEVKTILFRLSQMLEKGDFMPPSSFSSTIKAESCRNVVIYRKKKCLRVLFQRHFPST